MAWLDPSLEVWLIGACGFVATAAALYALGCARYPAVRLIYPAAAISAAAYAVVGAGLWITAQSLGILIGPSEIVVALSGTLLFQLIPVNLVGVSFGEVAGMAIYMAYGLDRPEAIFLVTNAYLQRLGAALVGGALEAVQSAHWLLDDGRDAACSVTTTLR